MSEKNVLVPPKSLELVEGLIPWNFEDMPGFKVENFRQSAEQLNAFSLEHVPGEQDVYIVGTDRVAYGHASPDYLDTQINYLQSKYFETKVPIRTAFGPDEPIINLRDVEIEAKLRTLHLALGRACLFKATLSSTRREFQEAVDDLDTAFSIDARPMYPVKFLNASSHSSGLLYLFKRAALKHKTIPEDQAYSIIDKISKLTSDGDSWFFKAGANLARNIGSPKPSKISDKVHSGIPAERKALNRQLKQHNPDNGEVLVFVENDRKLFKTDFEKFTDPFLEPYKIDPKGLSQEEILDKLYETFTGKEKQRAVLEEHYLVVSAAVHGINAYLVSRGDQNTVATKIHSALQGRGTNSLLPVLLLANMIKQKLTLNEDATDSPYNLAPVIELRDSSMPEVLNIIRKAVNSDKNNPNETEVSRKLYLVLHAFFRDAFGNSIIQY